MDEADLTADAAQRLADAVERLCHRAGAGSPRSSTVLLPYSGEQGDAVRRTLKVLAPRMGVPALYGGDSRGPNIRWRDGARCLLLDSGEAGGRESALRLTSHTTDALEQRERVLFEQGVGDGDGQLPAYADLPVLWQLHRDAAAAPPPLPPCVAPDWERLEESLRTLMLAWATQLPSQAAGGSAGFDVVNHADGDRPLTFLYGPEDGLVVMVDDEDAAPDDVAHEQEMAARGWHDRAIPVARWWVSGFDADASGAAATARLAVAELRARGARRPSDLGVADITCTDVAGEEIGRLTLPGLGLSG
ncbi:hypothetical protein F0344_01290 [Streptomyces finlayi]|uniref:Uncharacterized protein n=1 Tax=Streptomyces finlayi TaxID=67296 RepID=A0A7G7BDL7_9ACTN|nr:hypothetical protein [Streptomyces finlayi]QNE73432.1 hypothetical protein F0344_01290 [Streptomyces finlayi]